MSKQFNRFDETVLNKLAAERGYENWEQAIACFDEDNVFWTTDGERVVELARLEIEKKIEEMQFKETLLTNEDQIRFKCLQELLCFLREK